MSYSALVAALRDTRASIHTAACMGLNELAYQLRGEAWAIEAILADMA